MLLPIVVLPALFLGCSSSTDAPARVGVTKQVNRPPTATVLSPAVDTVWPASVPVPLTGLATDPDEASEALSVWWESDVQGLLGSDPPSVEGAVSTLASLQVGTHEVTLWVEDAHGAKASDGVQLTVGITSPSVTWVTAPPQTPANEGEVLVLEALVADPDQDPSTLSLQWVSDRDGPISTAGADSGGRAEARIDGLTPGVHVITLTAEDDDGLFGSASLIVPINDLPSPPAVSLSPAAPTTSDDLVAMVVVPSVDLDGDDVTYVWSWAMDGASTAYAASSLPSQATSKGQSWAVTATPSDPYGEGVSASATVVIANTSPSVTSVSVAPTAAFTDSLLTATVAFADADADAVTLAYTWAVDGVVTGETGPTLDGALWFDKGQEVVVDVEAHDGTAVSPPHSSTPLVVLNTAPAAPDVVITPSAPTGGDDLVCEISQPASDPDGELITYEFAWFVDGALFLDADETYHPGDTVPAAYTADGDNWLCEATPSDGEATGPPGTALAALCTQVATGSTYASCDEILAATGVAIDGVYTIDPDGPGGATEPFCAHCLMTEHDGGWTLFANHADDVSTKEATGLVTPDALGVLDDDQWVSLMATATEGMLFIDEHGGASRISIGKLAAANCTTPYDVASLLGTGATHLIHTEQGCNLAGVDYTIIQLAGSSYSSFSVAGAALYNASPMTFDEWAYGAADVSYFDQDELLCYVK